jgi:hypothetical protein
MPLRVAIKITPDNELSQDRRTTRTSHSTIALLEVEKPTTAQILLWIILTWIAHEMVKYQSFQKKKRKWSSINVSFMFPVFPLQPSFLDVSLPESECSEYGGHFPSQHLCTKSECAELNK